MDEAASIALPSSIAEYDAPMGDTIQDHQSDTAEVLEVVRGILV